MVAKVGLERVRFHRLSTPLMLEVSACSEFLLQRLERLEFSISQTISSFLIVVPSNFCNFVMKILQGNLVEYEVVDRGVVVLREPCPLRPKVAGILEVDGVLLVLTREILSCPSTVS